MDKSEMTIDDHVFAVTSAAGMNEELATNRLQNLQEDERVKIITVIVGVDTKQVAESLKRIAEIFTDAIKAYKKALGLLFEIQDFVSQIDFDEINRAHKSRRALYKLDFSRSRIYHQVINRKPRYLVKKIIR